MPFVSRPWDLPSDYGTRTSTVGIVVHHSGPKVVTTWEAIDAYHRSFDWGGIGYNVGIDVNGDVTVFGDINSSRAHTLGHNDTKLGLCFMAVDAPNMVQIQVGKEVVAWLRSLYGDIPLHRHSQFVSTACPGNWDIASLETKPPAVLDHLDQLWGVANEVEALHHVAEAARIKERIVAIKIELGL